MENMPCWRREATVWLDTTSPGLPAEKREAFYEAVDQYHRQNQTAERDAHFLSALQEDHEAFTRILDEVTADGPDNCSS